jgi:hypothetical protein
MTAVLAMGNPAAQLLSGCRQGRLTSVVGTALGYRVDGMDCPSCASSPSMAWMVFV